MNMNDIIKQLTSMTAMITELQTENKNVKKEVDALIELLGIEKISTQYPATLSGGERQRVAIARSIINNPKIILADEPTGNLDDETTKGIIELFIRLREERGITTILATHENELIEQSDCIYHIEEGRVESIDEPGRTLNTIKKRKSDKERTLKSQGSEKASGKKMTKKAALSKSTKKNTKKKSAGKKTSKKIR